MVSHRALKIGPYAAQLSPKNDFTIFMSLLFDSVDNVTMNTHLKRQFIFHSPAFAITHLLTNVEMSSLKYIGPIWWTDHGQTD